MSKIHLCCGGIYLKGYKNYDFDGVLLTDLQKLINTNPNETTLDRYFKDEWQPDASKRVRKTFVIDEKMDILKPWPIKDNFINEIVMISAFEHFEHATDIPHIIAQALRVLVVGGDFKFDFPNIKAQVDKYHGVDDEFLMELIYCNHKNKHSMHMWGYTQASIVKYFSCLEWRLGFGDIVKHDYPMQGVTARKL